MKYLIEAMKYLIETYEISHRNLWNLSRKPMKYLKETHHVCQGLIRYL